MGLGTFLLFLVGLGIFLFMRNEQQRKHPMESSYRQEELQPGRVRFTVAPAPIAAPRFGPLAGAFLGALILGSMGPKNGIGSYVLVAVGGWLGWTAFVRFFRWRAEKFRTPGGSFIASAEGIETSSGLIARDQLHQLVVRNGVPGLDDQVIVVTGGSLPAAFAADGAIKGAVNRAAVAAVCWNLCAEAGGRSTTLAGGMTDITARGLMTDVSRRLGTYVQT
jgi:hypothetical protein